MDLKQALRDYFLADALHANEEKLLLLCEETFIHPYELNNHKSRIRISSQLGAFCSSTLPNYMGCFILGCSLYDNNAFYALACSELLRNMSRGTVYFVSNKIKKVLIDRIYSEEQEDRGIEEVLRQNLQELQKSEKDEAEDWKNNV